MKTIDLCCGIGGIRRGFELAGDFENVLSAEKDEYACRTYQHLFGDDPRHDVTDEAFKELVTRTEYDVLLAGFPCQAFSKVGLRKGFRDVTKGTIFFDIVEIIDRTMPKVVFLENVENLVSHNKGETFRIILNTLENELNYHVIGVERDEKGELTFDKKSFIRNTKNFGLPQNRPRVYMVAFSRDYFGKHLDVLPKGNSDRRTERNIPFGFGHSGYRGFGEIFPFIRSSGNAGKASGQTEKQRKRIRLSGCQ